MLPSRPLLTALLAGAALLSASAAADASTVHITEYQVDAHLDGEYHMTAAPPDGTAAVNATYTVDVTMPKVTLYDGVLRPTDVSLSKVSNARTIGHFTGDGHSADCEGGHVNMIDAGGEIHPLAGGQAVLSPFGGLAWSWDCTDTSVPSGLALVNLKDAGGSGPLDAIIAPPDATSPATVVRAVDRTVEGAECPLYSEYTLSCMAHMEGTVTFTRTGERDGEPGPPQVMPPDPGYPPITDPGTQVGDLIPRSGRLGRDARRLHVKVFCGGYRCRAIRLDVFAYNTGSTGALGVRREKPLATRRLSLAAGAAKRIAFHFNRKARRAIKHSGGVRVVVTTGSVHRSFIVKLPGHGGRTH